MSSGVVGGGAAFFRRLICFTITKMMNARIRKLRATVTKLPYARIGTPAFRMTRRAPDFTDVQIDLEVYDLQHLTAIIAQLRAKAVVAKAERVNG